MKDAILKEAGADTTIDALKKLLKGKADAYEIFFTHDRGFSVEAKEGTVDALKVRSNTGVGLRTILNKKQGFAFSSVLTDDALSDLVSKALSGSLEATEDKFLSFPEPVRAGVDEEILELFEPSFGKIPEEDKIKAALSIEKSAMAFDSRVKRVRKASFAESFHSGRIVNSNGVDATHAATYYSGSVTAVAEADGESQMGWEIGMGHGKGAIDPDKIGRGAAGNAVRLLGAQKIKTVKCPAIIENTVACELLEALAGSLLGDNVHKGKSMLIGKVGQRIASPSLNIWDDGVLKGGWATSAFDGEGVAKGRTQLLSEGVCQGYLYDSYWAVREGVQSTGNAARSNYKSFPTVGISNLYIEAGSKSFDELLKDMEKGIFVTEVLGVHTINTVSGDFSLGAAGFWVEGGKIAYPIRGMAVSGNLLGLFSQVESCGADIRFIGSIGAPSLLINEIEASGS
ncbi:MAG: TldD/PmbA family protein [Deltaproteobacteria bacterium]|nr:TldD/PmbA family protein [Deltaproteobacteria bacterium]